MNYQDHYTQVFKLYRSKKLPKIISGNRKDISGLGDYDIFLYAIGSYIEFEHTDDLLEACKIAAVHLKEDERYYHKLLSKVESVPELDEFIMYEKDDLEQIIRRGFKEIFNNEIKIVMEYFSDSEAMAVMMDVTNNYFLINKLSKDEYLLAFVKIIPQTYESPQDWDIEDVKKSQNFLVILNHIMGYYFEKAADNFYMQLEQE